MKNWWKSFFIPITGEVMFDGKLGKQTENEVKQVFLQLTEVLKNRPSQGETKSAEKFKVLDLCCGEGRHSILMASQGLQVTGLDFSKDYLRSAKKKATVAKKKLGKEKSFDLNFFREDMKQASQSVPKKSFDLVTSLYNSFGYFDKRSDDYKVLTEAAKVLKPGGYFVLNTLNGNGVKFRLQPGHSIGSEPKKNLFVIDRAFLNLKKMTTHSEWKIIDARKKKTRIFRATFSQNVYTHKELKSLLKKAGFRTLKVWGRLDGEEFSDSDSWHQTILAQKI